MRLEPDFGSQAHAHDLRPGPWPNKECPRAKIDRDRFCVTDAEVLEIADHSIKIEDHYSSSAGHPMPMDIEWAKDADDGQIYIIQARPETVASRREPTSFETYNLKESAPVLVTGRAVGEKIAVGPVRVIADARELAKFRPGEVLVTELTSPDWEPVMKIAAAIVTERGGRTCHAAIVARELGVPAVVGAIGAKEVLKTGSVVTCPAPREKRAMSTPASLHLRLHESRCPILSGPAPRSC